ncbi:MAG: isoprenylcysteine carboxylmethyltransferase family protein [Candidatus Odinarchaeota archaeon]
MSNSIPKIKRKTLCGYSLLFIVFFPLITFFGGWGFDILLGLPSWPPFPLNIIFGLTVLITGIAIGRKATLTLLKNGKGLPWGELVKEDSTKRLVRTGLYSRIRHPMTLGYCMLPAGMGLLFRSIGMTVFITLIIFTIMIIWLKTVEEPRLIKRFGSEYIKYMRKVPFIIPYPGKVWHNPEDEKQPSDSKILEE